MTNSQQEPGWHKTRDNGISLRPVAWRGVAKGLRKLLAHVFTLYLKTKNFHWHMTGPHFRDYHLLLDEQADQLFAMSDVIAERARKPGVHSERRNLQCNGFRESAYRSFRGMISSISRGCEPTADR